jgi:hypothetical protein
MLNVIVMGMNNLGDFESGSARRPHPAGDSRSVLETVPGSDRLHIPGVIIDKIQDIDIIRQSVPNNVRIHDMPEVVSWAISSLVLLRRNSIRPFTSETSLEDLQKRASGEVREWTDTLKQPNGTMAYLRSLFICS